jgi:hypothetical protein
VRMAEFRKLLAEEHSSQNTKSQKLDIRSTRVPVRMTSENDQTGILSAPTPHLAVKQEVQNVFAYRAGIKRLRHSGAGRWRMWTDQPSPCHTFPRNLPVSADPQRRRSPPPPSDQAGYSGPAGYP